VLEGVSAGHLAIEEHSDRIEVRMMLLAPHAQGRGIGSLLMRNVMERANSRGLPVTLWVMPGTRER
jgi:GNAT superfamily N-acetyltransferase